MERRRPPKRAGRMLRARLLFILRRDCGPCVLRWDEVLDGVRDQDLVVVEVDRDCRGIEQHRAFGAGSWHSPRSVPQSDAPLTNPRRTLARPGASPPMGILFKATSQRRPSLSANPCASPPQSVAVPQASQSSAFPVRPQAPRPPAPPSKRGSIKLMFGPSFPTPPSWESSMQILQPLRPKTPCGVSRAGPF